MNAYDVRIDGTDVHFPCRSDQTLLDAALLAGIEMPYSCRRGVCGNCAGGVAAGEVDGPPGELAGHGRCLFCQCRPRSDLAIVPSAWHRIDPAARKRFKVKVYRNQLAADDVSILQLRLPAGQRARFRAGQYLQVLLDDGSRRAYSMANPPHESDALQLHVRRLAGGRFSSIAAGLKPGDLLDVELPFGSFELREASSAPMLCIVGGTGFAPVKSLLDDMAKRQVRRPVTLIWGARQRSGLYLMAAVDRWQRAGSDFTFVAALEDGAEAEAAQAVHGRVDAAVRQRCPRLAGFEVYCCGAPAMVAAVRAVCVGEKGLAAHDFFSDVFVDGPAAPAPEA